MRIPSLDSRAARCAMTALLCLTLVSGAAAEPEPDNLQTFLEHAEKMATSNEKVKADITIKEADGTTRTAVLVVDPSSGGTLTFTEQATGRKSVTPLSWKDGTVVEKTGAAEHKLGADDPLAGSDLRGLDFFPFWKTDYSGAQTSDENTLERTVSLYAAKGRPYTLYVISFDKTKLVPRMIKYYKDSFNNLVRIRTDKDFVMVGSRPRPTQMLVRDFATGSIRTYEFKWSLVDDAGAAPAVGK